MSIINSTFLAHAHELAVGDLVIEPASILHGVYVIEDVDAYEDKDGEGRIILDLGVMAIDCDRRDVFQVVG